MKLWGGLQVMHLTHGFSLILLGRLVLYEGAPCSLWEFKETNSRPHLDKCLWDLHHLTEFGLDLSPKFHTFAAGSGVQTIDLSRWEASPISRAYQGLLFVISVVVWVWMSLQHQAPRRPRMKKHARIGCRSPEASDQEQTFFVTSTNYELFA